ncbi:hypothetical protein [Flagellimonas sp.]|uniref:hypothetical protein n=1 Tax=Flagellimonas sp. TaxID=2058762 RepID=UPI003BAB1811
MEAIEEWFNGSLDYQQGVIIYASLPTCNHRTLRQLQKGRNSRNMSVLVSNLRKAKSSRPKKSKPIPKKIEKLVPPVKTEDVSREINRKVIAQKSAEKEYDGIRMGDLPHELRPKFSRARTLFYEMIELKFFLNDMEASDRENALQVILEIEKRDEERDLLWEALNHWKKFKKLLPEPKDELDGLDPGKLYVKKRNLTSSITKISKRIQEKEKALGKETDGHKRLLLKSSINKSCETIHKHRVLINKINQRL